MIRDYSLGVQGFKFLLLNRYDHCKNQENCIVVDFLKSLTVQGKIPTLQGINPAGMNPSELREQQCNPTQLGIFPEFFQRVWFLIVTSQPPVACLGLQSPKNHLTQLIFSYCIFLINEFVCKVQCSLPFSSSLTFFFYSTLLQMFLKDLFFYLCQLFKTIPSGTMLLQPCVSYLLIY